MLDLRGRSVLNSCGLRSSVFHFHSKKLYFCEHTVLIRTARSALLFMKYLNYDSFSFKFLVLVLGSLGYDSVLLSKLK
jgi:hypothetical protein